MPIKYKDLKDRWDEKMGTPLDSYEMGLLTQVCEYVDQEIVLQFNEFEKIDLFLYYFNFTTNIGTGEKINLPTKRRTKLLNTIEKLYQEAGWEIKFGYGGQFDENHLFSEDRVILTPLKNKKND